MVKEFEVDEEINGVVTGNKIYKKFKILTGRQEGAQILPNPTISYTQCEYAVSQFRLEARLGITPYD